MRWSPSSTHTPSSPPISLHPYLPRRSKGTSPRFLPTIFSSETSTYVSMASPPATTSRQSPFKTYGKRICERVPPRCFESPMNPYLSPQNWSTFFASVNLDFYWTNYRRDGRLSAAPSIYSPHSNSTMHFPRGRRKCIYASYGPHNSAFVLSINT